MKQSQEEIRKQVLAKIAPSPEEDKRIKGAAEKLAKRIKEESAKLGVSAKPMLVGSVAKGTYIRTKPDIDVFIQFPKDTTREKLEESGLAIGKAILSEIELRYAEHPYTHGKFEGYDADVVPCFEVSDASQKLSAVDRTPFHTEYVLKHLKEGQRFEILLFKQFLKGIGVYGAEEEIQGFSGYLCEIIVLKYGNFQKTIDACANWKEGETIALEKVKHPWFDSALTFIDPVDPNRNVASALSRENFLFFVNACKKYLANPKMEFFFPNPIKPMAQEELKNRLNSTFITVRFSRPVDLVADTLFPQVRKCAATIAKLCEEWDFKVKRTAYFVDDKITALIELEAPEISRTVIHGGPPEKIKENAEKFIAKWKSNSMTVRQPYVENGRYFVEIKREFTKPAELIKSKINTLNIGKHLAEAIKDGYEMRTGAEIVEPRYA
ncbi:MAG: CCA tRNA nucleotidyltransferase, partial [Candidatus Thermoplasmatota archaeon]|nr:CCA tRNA nucleotidyltransferase [Candidatus Thermoplasmatota archaeon]